MDKVFYNGSIITMAYKNESEEIDNSCEAVLVRDGKIYKIGSYEEVSACASVEAEKINLAGKCLMPAFIDSHSHFMTNGQMSMCADLSGCNCFQDIIDVLKKYIKDRKIEAGQAVIGFGYDHNFLSEMAHPNKKVLDRVSTEIPILIFHISLHLACANSKALSLAEIQEKTSELKGGVIGFINDTMELSGYLEESAAHIVQKALVPYIKYNQQELMSNMQETYLKYGITTVQDGAITKNEWMLLMDISHAGLLKLDVVAYPLISADNGALMHEYGEEYAEYKNHVKMGGYKLILDGSPQGRSAWMSKPYLGGEEGYCGYPWFSDNDVDYYVTVAVREKKQILAHCNGDAASEQYLNAYEKALEATGITDDMRPVMIHCQTVRNDQLDRMEKISMVASVFVGHVWYWGDIHVKNFGKERGNRISPVRDALERGLHVNFHQDTPVTKPNMLHSVWCAVNRISRSGKVIGENQKVSVYDALRAVTVEAAYEYFEENIKGSIEEGKIADLVVLEKSPLEVAAMEIKDIKVLQTYKEGNLIFKNKFITKL